LINAARGTVVDIDALAKALEEGKIRGAAIDVFPEEPASINEAIHARTTSESTRLGSPSEFSVCSRTYAAN